MSYKDPFARVANKGIPDNSVYSSIKFSVNRNYEIIPDVNASDHIILFTPGRNVLLEHYQPTTNVTGNGITHGVVFPTLQQEKGPTAEDNRYFLNSGYFEYRVVSMGFKIHNIASAKDVAGKYEMFDMVINPNPVNFKIVDAFDENNVANGKRLVHVTDFFNNIINDDYTQHQFYTSGHILELENKGLKLNEKVKHHRFITTQNKYAPRVPLLNPGNAATLDLTRLDVFDSECIQLSKDIFDTQYYIKFIRFRLEPNQRVLISIKINYEVLSDDNSILRYKSYLNALHGTNDDDGGGGGGGRGPMDEDGPPPVTPGGGGEDDHDMPDRPGDRDRNDKGRDPRGSRKKKSDKRSKKGLFPHTGGDEGGNKNNSLDKGEGSIENDVHSMGSSVGSNESGGSMVSKGMNLVDHVTDAAHGDLSGLTKDAIEFMAKNSSSLYKHISDKYFRPKETEESIAMDDPLYQGLEPMLNIVEQQYNNDNDLDGTTDIEELGSEYKEESASRSESNDEIDSSSSDSIESVYSNEKAKNVPIVHFNDGRAQEDFQLTENFFKQAVANDPSVYLSEAYTRQKKKFRNFTHRLKNIKKRGKHA